METETFWAHHYANQAREAIENRDAAIRNLRAAGWSLREIAAEVGLSPEGVNKILKRETTR